MGTITIDSSLRTVEWKDNKVIMIEQTKLPNELIFVEYDDFNQVANAIKTLIVRGAPAIGVSGAFGLGLAALQSKAITKDELLSDLEDARKILFATRPTAVNLGWGLKKIMNVAKTGETVEQIRELVISAAKKMADVFFGKFSELISKEPHLSKEAINVGEQNFNNQKAIIDLIESIRFPSEIVDYKYTQKNNRTILRLSSFITQLIT